MKHHSSSSKRRSTLQMKFRVTSGFQEIGQRSLSALRNLDIRCVARILLKTQMLNRAHSLGLPIQESLDVLILENSRNHRRVQCSYCKPVSFANIKQTAAAFSWDAAVTRIRLELTLDAVKNVWHILAGILERASLEAPMRILLVDDSKLQRYANAQALAHAGYNVTTAGDGAEGLRIARQTLPDLILLDM